MVFSPNPGETVTKLMSCTLAEFESGIERLTGAPAEKDQTGLYDLSAAAGGLLVTCSFERQPDAVLGGLMRLPRARVTLHLAEMHKDNRDEFIGRFDQTFQRGGG